MLLGTEIPCYSVAYASGKYCPFIPSGSGNSWLLLHVFRRETELCRYMQYL